jgi:hypothetical protein
MEKEVPPAWSLPCRPLSCELISLLFTRLTDWYDQLTPLARFVLISSIFGSSFFALHVSSPFANRSRGRLQHLKLRLLLLVTMLLALAGILLSLPLSFATTQQTEDSDDFIPTIQDPNAVNPQSVCPGYKLSSVVETKLGLVADLVLAGDACNVYGTDIEQLSLIVEYQATDRLHIEIQPKYIGQKNESWFILPDALLLKPKAEANTAPQSDLLFSTSNDPTFSFKVTRKSTGDVLFTTEGTQLVYEDQFIEFGSSLPENYNLYGLGETIHSLRLGNNLTSTFLMTCSFSLLSSLVCVPRTPLTSRYRNIIQR